MAAGPQGIARYNASWLELRTRSSELCTTNESGNLRAHPVGNPILQAFWNRLLGDRGEQEAARYLRRQGLRILQRGYRTDHGEVDLIALDGNIVVFV